MVLTNKRRVFLNTRQDTLALLRGQEVRDGTPPTNRGDFIVPIPQQLQDPHARDIVYRMYIEQASIKRDVPNINQYNDTFMMAVCSNYTNVGTPYASVVQTGVVRMAFQITLPHYDVSPDDLCGILNGILKNSPVPHPDHVADPTMYTFPFVATRNSPAPYAAGSYLMFTPARPSDHAWDYGDDAISGAQFGYQMQNLALAFYFGPVRQDPFGVNNIRQENSPDAHRLLGFPSRVGPGTGGVFYLPGPLPSFVDQGGAFQGGVVGNEIMRSVAPAPMQLDYLTEIHVNTELNLDNFSVTPAAGFGETRITAVVPIRGPFGSTIYYLDDKGINAAMERNQFTLSSLHVWLTDQYDRPYTPNSDWSFVFVIETEQQEFQYILNVMQQQAALSEEHVRLSKLGLIASQFVGEH